MMTETTCDAERIAVLEHDLEIAKREADIARSASGAIGAHLADLYAALGLTPADVMSKRGITHARKLREKMIDVLAELDENSEADGDSEGWTPNWPMSLATQIREGDAWRP